MIQARAFGVCSRVPLPRAPRFIVIIDAKRSSIKLQARFDLADNNEASLPDCLAIYTNVPGGQASLHFTLPFHCKQSM
jgi:hypothetical protein